MDQKQDQTTETEYSLATGAHDTSATQIEGMNVAPHRTGKKQGHNCCGGCCDMRRSVIIVNIVNASLMLIALMMLIALASASAAGENNPELEEALVGMDAEGIGFMLTSTLVKLAINLLGIYGAMKYNIWMVGSCGTMYILDGLYALVTGNLGHLVYTSLFAYPHFFFVREVLQGTMTPENYPINEEHSCCCV